jgi:hypothetical protein
MALTTDANLLFFYFTAFSNHLTLLWIGECFEYLNFKSLNINRF